MAVKRGAYGEACLRAIFRFELEFLSQDVFDHSRDPKVSQPFGRQSCDLPAVGPLTVLR